MSASKLIAIRRAQADDAAALAAIQAGAFARNRAILGVEPLPLLTSASEIIAEKEAWLLEVDGAPVAALALEAEGEALLIWSVATAPGAEGRGHGRRLLAFAHERARADGFETLKLYTGEKLVDNVDWYRRNGFAVDRVEALVDRRVVHMSKRI